MNDNTSLALGSDSDGQYVMVINESKDDFADGFTMKEYLDVIRQQMNGKIEGAEWSSDYESSIGDYPAIYTEVSGTISGVELYYFIYIVETANSFNQVIGWTSADKADENADAIAAVMDTFVEYEA
jgi:hypothetical protein